MKRDSLKSTLVICGCYALLAAGWILGGFAVTDASFEPSDAALFELFKGLGYVAITTVFLFFLLRWWRQPPTVLIESNQIASEFQQTIRSGEATLRWLPYGTAFALVVLLCLLSVGLWSVRERALEAGRDTAAVLNYAIGSQIDGTLTHVKHTLGEVADELRSRVPVDHHEKMQAVRDSLQPIVRAAWVLDRDGRIILDSDYGNIGFDLSGREYYFHHRNQDTSEFFLSDPVQSKSTGTWFVGASMPYRAPDGALMGVIVVALDIGEFTRYWNLELGGRPVVVTLLRGDGALLMRNDFNNAMLANTPGEIEAWRRQSPHAGSGTFLLNEYAGGYSGVYAFGSLPSFPLLQSIVGLPKSTLLSGWTRLAISGLSAFAIAVGLSWFTIFVLHQQFRRRIASQKLAASLARYPLNNINPVMTLSSTGERKFLNSAAKALLDEAVEDDGLMRSLAALASKPEPGSTELQYRGRILAVSHLPNGDDTGDLYLVDISEQRQDQSMLRMFFDLPFMGMALTSAETKRWTQVNDSLCTMLGYSREELLERTWAEVTHPDDLEADVEEFQSILAGASDGYTMDKRFIRKDGSVVHATIDVKVVRTLGGGIVQFLATIQDISERVLAHERLTRQRNLYAALTDTNHAIIVLRDRDKIFQAICKAAVQRAGLRFGWIGMLDEAERALQPVARYGEDQGYIDAINVEVDPEMKTGQGPGGRAVREGRHQIVNRISGDPVMAPWMDAAKRAGVDAVGAFPLKLHDRVIGVFSVYSAQAEFFDFEVVDLLDEMARDLSFALEFLEIEELRAVTSAELTMSEQRFRRAVEEAPFPALIHAEDGEIMVISRTWSEITGYARQDLPTIPAWTELAYGAEKEPVEKEINELYSLTSRRDEGEFTIRCRDGSLRIWKFSSISLGSLPDGRRVAMSMAADVTELRDSLHQLAEAEASYRRIVEQSLVGIFLMDGEVLLYANKRVANILGYEPEEIAGSPIERFVCDADLPDVAGAAARLLAGDAVIETLEFRARRKDSSEILIGTQATLSKRSGAAVIMGVMQDITERRQAEQEIQSYVDQLESTFKGTVGLATNLVEMRDPYTAGHASRVGMIAAAIGTELGLDEEMIEGLQVAGQLHDIGKIQTPAELLSSPRKLLPFELELIKFHAQAGHDVLEKVDFPWPLADVAHQHHERMDGSGYPQGLKGDAICLEARIIAVADVVEAMASHRPYRPGLGIDKALDEIERGRDRFYDADVCDACLRLFREKGFVLPAR